jgi:hypothetical protein
MLNTLPLIGFEMKMQHIKSCPRAYLIKHYAMKAYGGVDV